MAIASFALASGWTSTVLLFITYEYAMTPNKVISIRFQVHVKTSEQEDNVYQQMSSRH